MQSISVAWDVGCQFLPDGGLSQNLEESWASAEKVFDSAVRPHYTRSDLSTTAGPRRACR